jgi:hypothetical protein
MGNNCLTSLATVPFSNSLILRNEKEGENNKTKNKNI